MDTKWKKSKNVISFLIFFLGVSLTLGNAIDILRSKPEQTRVWELDKMLEEDYQQTNNFRSYIANRLELFLCMATNDISISEFYSGYFGDFFGEFFNYNYYDYPEMDYPEEFEKSPEELARSEELQRLAEEIDAAWISGGKNSLSEEEKKLILQGWHDQLKGDLNLLYSVSFDGQVMYANSELLPSMDDPANLSNLSLEGYNFFLYFDGEKVTITKDGGKLDVYGDGYYRDDNDWYVPGYRNFQMSEQLKKARICIAAARNPVLYTEGAYGDGGYRQLENALYWMQYYRSVTRQLLLERIMGFGFGILLLFLAFFLRKSRKEASAGLACIQSKIWIECKALLLFTALYLLYLNVLLILNNNVAMQELRYAFDYADSGYTAETVFYLGRNALSSIPSPLWLALFWVLYLIWNDLRHNKKIWQNGLIPKLYRLFTARELNTPLPCRMARRNQRSLLTGAAYGLWMIVICLLGAGNVLSNWLTLLLAVSGTAVFLAFSIASGRKNMETARDVETLSNRISDIRNGDYTGRPIEGNAAGTTESPSSGHDLRDVMTQLEDIRQGMKYAVDEQMKSERMKVELIANVSHDIKTPLTSIISYVQFLKEEKDLPDHVKDYVTILDEKSKRLNNMIQDVFAVSKAASGELPMHMEQLDFGKLLQQTMADMQEQIDNSAVTFRTELPGSPVLITADGQRLYRVFQNLFQNALKYSLSGSRVYVALKTEKGTAIASVKNTSRLELEREKDFTERFTRGDQSRTDGGSGLGLSIAQSFTEACGGQFHWETDADLFVVTVSFPTAEA